MPPRPELPLSEGEQRELALEALRLGQPIELDLKGPCMRPWLFSGDRVRIEPRAGRPRRGSVVLVRDGETLLTHRVLRSSAGFVWTRGDLSDAPDPPWPNEQILGYVVSARGRHGVTVPLGGRWVALAGLAAAPLLRLVHRAWRARRR